MENNTITFNGEEHPYQVPEFYGQVKEYKDKYGKYSDAATLDNEAKQIYENLVFAKIIGEKPAFISSGFSDNLLFDDEDNLDEALVKDWNSANKKQIKRLDELPEKDKNYLLAQRFRLFETPTLQNLQDEAFARYNSTGREERARWTYKPEFTGANPIIQNTSPSRQHLLGMTGQQIDPSFPIFLQIPNPHIPWGMNHPLRQMWMKDVQGKTDAQINSELRTMETIAGGVEEETRNGWESPDNAPFWYKQGYPALERDLESRIQRQSYSGIYPIADRPLESVPRFPTNLLNIITPETPFEEKLIKSFKKK